MYNNTGKVALLVALLVVAGLASGSDYRSEAGRFRIALPGVPQETTSGELHITSAGTDELSFNVMYSDAQQYSADALEAGIEKAAASINGLAVNNHKITFKGYEGREAVLVGESGGQKVTIVLRAIIVKNRLYQLMVLSSNPFGNQPEASQFIDSFELAAN